MKLANCCCYCSCCRRASLSCRSLLLLLPLLHCCSPLPSFISSSHQTGGRSTRHTPRIANTHRLVASSLSTPSPAGHSFIRSLARFGLFNEPPLAAHNSTPFHFLSVGCSFNSHSKHTEAAAAAPNVCLVLVMMVHDVLLDTTIHSIDTERGLNNSSRPAASSTLNMVPLQAAATIIPSISSSLPLLLPRKQKLPKKLPPRHFLHCHEMVILLTLLLMFRPFLCWHSVLCSLRRGGVGLVGSLW